MGTECINNSNSEQLSQQQIDIQTQNKKRKVSLGNAICWTWMKQNQLSVFCALLILILWKYSLYLQYIQCVITPCMLQPFKNNNSKTPSTEWASLPRVYAQGVKWSVLSVIVIVIRTKINSSWVLGVIVSGTCKCHGRLEIVKNWLLSFLGARQEPQAP